MPVDRFGPPHFYLDPDFLPASACQELIVQARQERSVKTGLVNQQAGSSYQNETARKTKLLLLPETSSAALSYRLMSAKPTLEAFFGLELLGCHPPQLLAYQPGDFFERHRDLIVDPPRLSWVRNLTVILFLNQPERDYQGGELVLYDVEADWPDQGLALPVQAGLLVAFLPHLYHEVRPVRSGQRYTVIDWYY